MGHVNEDSGEYFVSSRTDEVDLATLGAVLAVDDDKDSLEVLRDLLAISGFRVFTANHGRKALDVFVEQRPDVVITDIWMPELDGLEVLRQIRGTDETVPVILVTGGGDLDSAVKALRRGAYDFLLKPINPVILMNTVRKAVEHRRLKLFEINHRLLLEEQVQSRTIELAKANEFLKGILDSSTGVSIVLTDFQHNVLFWNTGAEKIFGYSADEMVGSSIRRLHPLEASQSETFESLSRLVQIKAGTIQKNVQQNSKDNKRLTLCLTVAPMIDASGSVSAILGLGQDVTEEVRLHDELVKSLERIQKIQGASIFALAKLAESRDDETAFHLKRLQAYCKALCQKLGLRKLYRPRMTLQFVEDLVQCSVLHDIGKLAIPDSILFTPRKFKQDEREIMKQHAIKGGKALEEAADEVGKDASYLSVGADVAYYHHEHWDGTGYPFRLEKEQIPLAARIVAIADVYDALTTERRYKKAYSHDEAVELIAREKGKQFDPELVEAFLEVAGEFSRIRDELSGADSIERAANPRQRPFHESGSARKDAWQK